MFDIKSGIGKLFTVALPIARIGLKMAYPQYYAAAEKALPVLEELAKSKTDTEFDDDLVAGIKHILFGSK